MSKNNPPDPKNPGNGNFIQKLAADAFLFSSSENEPEMEKKEEQAEEPDPPSKKSKKERFDRKDSSLADASDQ